MRVKMEIPELIPAADYNSKGVSYVTTDTAVAKLALVGGRGGGGAD